MGVNRGCRLTVNFRLFKDKGSEYQHGTGRLYTLADFETAYFPPDWYRLQDRLGDGCKIDFPVRLFCKVKWSPTVYVSSEERTVVLPKKKYFEEVCMVWIAKQRC